MDGVATEKKRSANWTHEERAVAVELILAEQEVLFGKFRGSAVNMRQKEAVWHSIANTLNASRTTCPRTVVEIKKMYQNTKVRAKDKMDQQHKTGGGPAASFSGAESMILNQMSVRNTPTLSGLQDYVDSLEKPGDVAETADDAGDCSFSTLEEVDVPVSTSISSSTFQKGLESSTHKTKSYKRKQEDKENKIYQLEERRLMLEIQKMETEIETIKRRNEQEEEIFQLKRQCLLKKIDNL